MQVLVTGATGAVGPVVIEALVAAGMRVRALVRSQPTVGLLPASVTLVTGDITAPETLDAAVTGCDAVVHLAALLHINNPAPALAAEYERVNVTGTANLLAAAQRHNIQRFLLVSTIAVYGKARQAAESPPLDETTPPQPDTLYGRTKLQAEALVLAARTAEGAAMGVVLRPAAIYGTRIKGNYARLYSALARGRFLPVGPGHNRRTLIYDRDLATAIVTAVTHSAATGRVYNVTDGDYHSLQQIIAAICHAQGHPPPPFAIPLLPLRLMVGILEDLCQLIGYSSPIGRATLAKYSEEIRVDGSRIQRELGFSPVVRLQAGWQTVAAEQDAENLVN